MPKVPQRSVPAETLSHAADPATLMLCAVYNLGNTKREGQSHRRVSERASNQNLSMDIADHPFFNSANQPSQIFNSH
jgi:hypothetical protein